MTSYLTIQTTTDARPRRVMPQNFARLFAEAETHAETPVQGIAEATLGLLGSLYAWLLASRSRTATHRGFAPRVVLRVVRP